MKRSLLSLMLCFFFYGSWAQNNSTRNMSMFTLDSQHRPVGWVYPAYANTSVSVDTLEKKDGKNSLVLSSEVGGDGIITASFPIPQTFKGSKIELKGRLKTEHVTGGYAGMWLRVDGTTSGVPLAFDNMNKRGLVGTNDWQEYSIQLPYDEDKANRIVLGGLIAGTGKLWMNDLRLYIDGKPVELAQVKKIKLLPAQQDTAFSKSAHIDTILLNKSQIERLKLLAEVWGVVKYHHPAVAKGEFNMDAELFRVLPASLEAKDDAGFSMALEKWVDKFGRPEVCKGCKPVDSLQGMQKPNYGSIFKTSVLNRSITDKLRWIINNHYFGESYYIDMAKNIGNPIFKNEPVYNMAYPDAGLRLLALFRYWNMINYFFPYKHLIEGDWEDTLPAFIPQFVQAGNTTEYLLASLKLISSIKDTHANIYSWHPALEGFRGKFALPVEAKFIEDKLVVTGYYADTLDVKNKLRIGDIISRIDGQKVEQLIQKYLPITAASNYATQLRDMPNYSLLRSSLSTFNLEIIRDGKSQPVKMQGVERSKLIFHSPGNSDPKAPAFKVMDGGIGYLFPGRYSNRELPEIIKTFQGTKGIVVDMRCYPSEFMPFTFVPYVKSGKADFVKFTVGSISNPGLFALSETLANPGSGDYKGKVVVIVNEVTQSQAEYTTMAFQSSPNVVVIGSTTAGADGNVSGIVLPGGINTMISGIGILYPDGTETQGKGVKIDYPIRPTIAGIKAGKDELLEKAVAIINGK